MGVPTLGCGCLVCTSSDPHDRRLRPSGLVRWQEGDRERVLVIDTGPDFREQALRNRLNRVDAVLYTHGHADHTLGLDDLRPLSFRVAHEGGMIPLFASEDTAEVLRRVYEYTFSPQSTYATRARVCIEPLQDRFSVLGVDFVRIPVLHGEMEISGFRFGSTAYMTDVSDIPESSFQLLQNLDVLIVSALRHKPHPSHATLDQAVGWARRVGARRTWFTHIAHDLPHETTNRSLPEGMALAYDGLNFPVSL
ncbi:MAG TPA: MBL fold metallo-hydrolase [Terracidiphilus sp.]|nr:MBL fold metallo-hydrolase [Terracidiphilus sp.]